MKAIKCELCGSNQLLKKEGFFQCEYCGTKYSLEEARKLLGKVEIEGDVSVKEADFIIRAGVLEKYNGSSVDVIIPDNVSIIGKSAFINCKGLKTVIIPNSVREIDDYAFWGCSNLKTINIPNGIEVIGIDVFKGCDSLGMIQLPDSAQQIKIRGYCKVCGYIPNDNHPPQICPVCKKPFEINNFQHIKRNKTDDKNKVHVNNKRDLFRKSKLCQYCGGSFKGVFTKVCSKCGKPKDY